MAPATLETADHSVVAFRGIIEETVETLAETFRASRIFTATLGLAVTLAVALSLSALAGVLLVGNLLAQASLVMIVGALALYAGLLLTFGALCRVAAAEREGETISSGAAFAFAFSRMDVVVGLPLFTLLVALGLGALGMRIGYQTGFSGVGSSLGPLALVALFVVNLVLILALFITHTLAGPCVACTELSFAGVGARIIRIGQEHLHHFLARQAAVLVVGLPLIVLTSAIFLGAFQPAFYSVASGRLTAEVLREKATQAALPRRRAPSSEGTPSGGLGRLRQWTESELPAAGGASLVGVGALAVLLLGVIPLAFAAAAETSVYLGLTGDRVVEAGAAAWAEPEAPAALRPEKHPPIVHCWRCDAISRFEDEGCAKCGARYAICPYCFATNQPGRATCASCGGNLCPEDEPAAAMASAAPDVHRP